MSKNNISVGSIVRFMNEVGGGRVTAILSKDLVSVETEDGFEIPTYIKNLVVVDPTPPLAHSQSPKVSVSPSLPFTPSPAPPVSPSSSTPHYAETKRSSFSEINQRKGNDLPEFVFAALPERPDNPPGGNIQLYLVNDCNFTLIYHFATKMAGQYTTVDAGMLEPNTKVELENIPPKGIGELPEYCFQLLYFRKQASQLEEPVQKEISISPVKFFKPSSFVKNDYFSSPALLIRLVDHPLKAELDKLTEKDFQQITRAKEPKKKGATELPPTDPVEVDLHIQQLLDDTSGLTNADMLKLQLDTFRQEMDKAIAGKVKRIVFIHGVGDGVLKNELRRELQRKYPRFPYQDASFREYGFGATMVIVRS